MFNTTNPGLMIIDMQMAIDSFSNEVRNNPEAENTTAQLLAHWRRQQWPVIHVRHSSKHLHSPYHAGASSFAFKPQVSPLNQEKIITKSENCAFIRTDLQRYLKENNINEWVVCGVLTNNSIDATVRVGAGLGYRIFVLHDATAAFGMTLLNGTHKSADEIHWIFLSNLHGEYATVCGASDIIVTA